MAGASRSSDLSGSPQGWTVPIEGGAPAQITTGDPVGRLGWSPAGDHLAFTAAPGGGMNRQVYTVRPDGSDSSRSRRWVPFDCHSRSAFASKASSRSTIATKRAASSRVNAGLSWWPTGFRKNAIVPR
jgi:hypothetical protein